MPVVWLNMLFRPTVLSKNIAQQSLTNTIVLKKQLQACNPLTNGFSDPAALGPSGWESITTHPLHTTEHQAHPGSYSFVTKWKKMDWNKKGQPGQYEMLIFISVAKRFKAISPAFPDEHSIQTPVLCWTLPVWLTERKPSLGTCFRKTLAWGPLVWEENKHLWQPCNSGSWLWIPRD